MRRALWPGSTAYRERPLRMRPEQMCTLRILCASVPGLLHQGDLMHLHSAIHRNPYQCSDLCFTQAVFFCPQTPPTLSTIQTTFVDPPPPCIHSLHNHPFFCGKFPSSLRLNAKKEEAFRLLPNGFRQRPILPGRVQPSTFGTEGLNFCVRYGNRWDPFVITTGNIKLFCSAP